MSENVRKIKITESRKTEAEVDVEVPFYREHDVSGDTYETVYFTKIEDRAGELVEVALIRKRGFGRGEEAWEIEVSPFRPSDGSSREYILGEGAYSLSAEAWEEERAACEAWLREQGVLP